MQQSLVPEFRKTATEAYKAFPKKLTVLVLPDGETPVYVSPQIADQLTESATIIRGTARIFASKLNNLRAQGGALRNYNLAGTQVDLIVVKDINGIHASTDPHAQMMETIFFLDHEIDLVAFDVMDKHRKDPDIFKAGERFLSASMVKDFMKETAAMNISALAENELWQKTLRFVEEQKTTASRPKARRPRAATARLHA